MQKGIESWYHTNLLSSTNFASIATDMADANLITRIERLEAIDELRRLKFNYTWHLDRKEWDSFAACFTKDFTFDGPGGPLSLEEFLATVPPSLQALETIHELHQYRFEFDGPDRAKGVWRLRDHLISPKGRSEFRGRAYYDETYVRTDQGWLISSLRLNYLNSSGSVGVGAGQPTRSISLVLGAPS